MNNNLIMILDMAKMHDNEQEITIALVKSLLKKQCPKWNKPPVWMHGDLLPGNILIQNNRLSAVIDFADLGLGDPACDLIVAWSLLNEPSRTIFRKHLLNIDEHTGQRGKGWALSIVLIIIPYYKNTNPVLTSVAKRMIDQLILSKIQ